MEERRGGSREGDVLGTDEEGSRRGLGGERGLVTRLRYAVIGGDGGRE